MKSGCQQNSRHSSTQPATNPQKGHKLEDASIIFLEKFIGKKRIETGRTWRFGYRWEKTRKDRKLPETYPLEWTSNFVVLESASVFGWR